jgi:hypothetical protein
MDNKNVLTRTLALSGTILIWLPIAAPLVLAVPAAIRQHRLLVDYLMPAELFPLVLFGGALLLWAALRQRAYRVLIGAGLGSALLFLVGSQALAVRTGLADGRTPIGGWQWALVLGMLVGYILAVIATGVGGVLMMKKVNKEV